MTKHEEILNYIESLELGAQVSVRRIANKLKVADGTAYKAIKEAENRGLVAVNDRSGTVRVAAKGQKNAHKLTFAKAAEITNAEILGGIAGLDVEFSRFIIAAMEFETVKKYLTTYGMVIVGNRSDVQLMALHEQNAVLVTGGNEVDQNVIDYANQMGIPLMRTTYDTFGVASRISHALSNELIKKDILTVSEVYHVNGPILREDQTVKDFLELMKKTNKSRFAVLNPHRVVVGVVTMRDANHKRSDTMINKIMTTANVAKLNMTIASVSQQMIHEGYDMMPVVSNDYTYVGTISKSDVLESLQKLQEESQLGSTFSDELSDKLTERGSAYLITIEPLMINSLGTISYGATTELISLVAQKLLAKKRSRNIIIESINLNFMGTVTLDSVLEIYPKVIRETRLGAIVDVEIYHVNQMIAKAVVNLQLT